MTADTVLWHGVEYVSVPGVCDGCAFTAKGDCPRTVFTNFLECLNRGKFITLADYAVQRMRGVTHNFKSLNSKDEICHP